jgi:serine/threonine protein kinase
MDFNPLDKYTIDKTPLGIGTYGSVYKGFDQVHKRNVAIKVIFIFCRLR